LKQHKTGGMITRSKVVSTDFGTRLKVLKAKNTIIRTFDLVPKSVPSTFGTRSKVFKLIELVPMANF
jgi:hypothetical protein